MLIIYLTACMVASYYAMLLFCFRSKVEEPHKVLTDHDIELVVKQYDCEQLVIAMVDVGSALRFVRHSK